jgi:hypothetical protein
MINIASSSCCIVTPETLGPFANGGVGTATYRLAELLTRHGYPVTILYTGNVLRQGREHWQRQYYDQLGIKLEVLSEWWQAQSIQDHDSILCYPPDGNGDKALRVCRFLEEHTFALAYLQDFMGHGLRTVQLKRSGLGLQTTQLVTWCHSSFIWSNRGNNRLISGRDDLSREAHERLGTQLCEQVVSPSRYMGTWLAENWQIERVGLLPCWYEDQQALLSGALKLQWFRPPCVFWPYRTTQRIGFVTWCLTELGVDSRKLASADLFRTPNNHWQHDQSHLYRQSAGRFRD